MSVTDFKMWAEAIQASLTALAILVAGAWTYLLFVGKRERYPRVRLSHFFTLFPLTSDLRLLIVTVEVSNIGTTLVRLERAKCRLQQVLPLDATMLTQLGDQLDLVPDGAQTVPWPTLAVRQWTFADGASEIEPSEAEVLRAEFLLPPSVNTILVYSYIANRTKRGREIGWSKTSFFNLEKGTPDERSQRDLPTSAGRGS